MAFKVTIVDNNLLRLMTSKGKAKLYENYYYALEGRGHLDPDVTRIILTPGGALEFLALPLPSITLENETALQTEATHLLKAEPFDAGGFNMFRTRVMNTYEKSIRQTSAFSKSTISRAIGVQRAHVDPATEPFIIPLLKGAVGNQAGRNLLYSRTAIDRMYLFPWPKGHKKIIMQSHLADSYAAFHAGMGFGSMRGFEFVWKDFAPHLWEKKDQFKVSDEVFKKDLQQILKCVSFKAKGDFLDVEAIHYCVVGRFHDGTLEPVIFSTNDPIEPLLIRLGIFKSMYVATHQIVTKEDDGLPTMAQGTVVVFNRNAEIEYEIKVDQVPPVANVVGIQPLEDWLNDMKRQFAFEKR